MTALALQLSLMAVEAALAATVLLGLFRMRRVLGFAAIYTALGMSRPRGRGVRRFV